MIVRCFLKLVVDAPQCNDNELVETMENVLWNFEYTEFANKFHRTRLADSRKIFRHYQRNKKKKRNISLARANTIRFIFLEMPVVIVTERFFDLAMETGDKILSSILTYK